MGIKRELLEKHARIAILVDRLGRGDLMICEDSNGEYLPSDEHDDFVKELVLLQDLLAKAIETDGDVRSFVGS